MLRNINNSPELALRRIVPWDSVDTSLYMVLDGFSR